MKSNTVSSAIKTGWVLLAAALFSACSALPSRFDEVSVHTWKTADEPNSFPEIDDPRVNGDWLAKRPSFGIAFSGGGTRSASATLGQLRALTLLGWLDQARYVSANSGGSWALWPYIYFPVTGDEDRFLGPYVPPGRIDDKILLHKESKDRDTLGSAIYRSKLGDKVGSVFRGDEAYADIIGKIFLEPFGLHDRGKFFTLSDKSRISALQANPDLKADDFYTVTRERPYPVVIGSLRVPVSKDTNKSELFLLEATPLYTGVRSEFRVPLGPASGTMQTLIGGGYVESFGYDSYEPEGATPVDGLWTVRLKGKLSRKDRRTNNRYRFTLSDVIGMSGAAPSIKGRDKGLRISTFVFPEFRHWGVDRQAILSDEGLRNEAWEIAHGDGGDTDNLAVTPLLARKLENILIFVNTKTKFPEYANCNRITEKTMVDDVIGLFRHINSAKDRVVIDDRNGTRLKSLCRAFAKRKEQGKPLVHCDRYPIEDNPRHGVAGKGYRPTICWVYLDRTHNWIYQLDPPEGKEGEFTRKLEEGLDPFDNFPHYLTFGEKGGGRVIDLNRHRVHAISNLTAWTVLESKDYLAGHLRGAFLPTHRASAD